eukprot:4646765-Prymnesium_polylepis.1
MRLAAGCPELISALEREARGGGYWLWKPLVVREALHALADGEALLYCDAGCTLRHEAAAAAEWAHKCRALHEGSPIDCYELSGTTIDGKPVSNGAWCTGDAATHILGAADPRRLEGFYARP